LAVDVGYTIGGHSDDYQLQLAVGQCPKRCIHYVTPSQRAVLEDLLDSILSNPYDMGEAAFLESLIIKATFKNNRFQHLTYRAFCCSKQQAISCSAMPQPNGIREDA